MSNKKKIKTRLPSISDTFLNKLSDEQKEFIVHPKDESCFLKACPGSGKTEVVGIKAAYEIADWNDPFSGICVLSFTKNSAKEISDRVAKYDGINSTRHPHFIGTIDAWLHNYLLHPFGHLVTGFKGREGDKSFQLLESNKKFVFLSSFQTTYKSRKGASIPIEVNDYYYDFDGKVETQNNGLDLSKFDKKKKKELKGAKSRFLSAGLSTYQDAEYICYQILDKQPDILESLSKRFSIIFIDECQDLSISQIRLFNKLYEKGVKLFFIGDLNQAIYDFRKVEVEKFIAFIQHHKIEEKLLTNNYRSNHQVVDVCKDLEQKITGSKTLSPIVAKEPVRFLENVFLWEYDDLTELPPKFITLLNKRNISISNSAILGRGHSLLSKIRPNADSSLKGVELVANSIVCWNLTSQRGEDLQNAINQIGKFLCKLAYKGKGNYQEYYCPNNLSPLEWRKFLSDFLGGLSKKLYPFDEKKWTEWVSALKKHLNQNWNELPIGAEVWSDVKTKVRSPNKKAKLKVKDCVKVSSSPSSDKIRISTIHKVKGETLDAVLVVSSKDKKSKGGHYDHWISDNPNEKEYLRIAYVASSRPKHLLIWAIPKKKTNPTIKELEKMGFKLETPPKK